MSDQAGKKLCPHCKQEVDIKASRCPHCQGKIYVWTWSKKLIAGFIVFIFLSVIFSSGSSRSSTPVTTQQGPSNVEVCVESEHILEGFLKSPSTAKYPTCNSITIERLANDQFNVRSYVDSQNGFGAMVRSNWSVKYHYTDSGTRTQLDSVVIDGKEMYK
ncbi:MAG: hypothetical protein WC847_02515 [Candidatus Paceibacterota bacterium]|jgi:hypothetical protein